jgi:hypothetical protein
VPPRPAGGEGDPQLLTRFPHPTSPFISEKDGDGARSRAGSPPQSG